MGELERIDAAIDGWRRAIPDLDVDTMRSVLLIGRASLLGEKLLENAFAERDLRPAEFDLMAALIQSEDHSSTPSDLARLAMLSPAGMTHRLDVLERAGLIQRTPDPADRRSVRVSLTSKGRATATAAAREHVAIEQSVLGTLTQTDRRHLDRIMAKIIEALELLGDDNNAAD